ncbi:MAG: hypothetical protein ACXWTX_02455 [Gallionella sp.]
MRLSKLIGFSLVALAFATYANAKDGNSMRGLMYEALSSQSGSARGIIEGKEADKIHQTTGSNDPTQCVVTTIKHFKEAGCSRLSIKLIQPNVPTQQGTKTEFAFNYELNLCMSGRPPLSTE